MILYNTNFLNGGYIDDLLREVKESENDALRQNLPSADLDALFDRNDSIAFGYGFDLLANRTNLVASLSSFVTAQQAGDTVTRALQDVEALLAGVASVTMSQSTALELQIDSEISLVNEANASSICLKTVQSYWDCCPILLLHNRQVNL